MNLHGILLHLSLLLPSATAFSTRSLVRPTGIQRSGSPIYSSTASTIDTDCTFTPIFDFADVGSNATSNFERIDDAIMGGISLSSIRQNPDEEFARWSGICRLDGGGFCGTRTLPFKSAFQVGDADGFYVLCRLTSDDEPDRRVWKLTTRSEASRSEQLYQVMFDLPASTGEENDWNLVKVKFSDFVQVRGPRVVEGGPKLNSSAIFQIGMALSKFKISSTGEQIENFRPGYFELQVKEIGAFREGKNPLTLEFPGTLEKEEAEKKKPLPLKVLGPVAKVFFSEKRRRSASAMRILKKRGYSTLGAMKFGVKVRARATGWPSAIIHTMTSLATEILLQSFTFTLKLLLVYPIQLIRKLTKVFSKSKSEAPKQ
ncbi:unnamed protein product [Cylindrotheca closterium]|uniref:NADH:ubiquinone oxidoreductase intermediate-associated protein 30 domain-containing protein n=1 Tax=Cylindrotheca closterium TaxID=2856 RepID=A0AAD2FAM8_9STRA|nr:unnamed protein product [Cylindrotheca closterium]